MINTSSAQQMEEKSSGATILGKEDPDRPKDYAPEELRVEIEASRDIPNVIITALRQSTLHPHFQ